MWYVIQVGAGKEEEIARELQKQGIRALVPVEDRPIHSKGAWIRKRYVIFSGYVFVNMTYQAENYYRVRKIPGVIRFLGDSRAPSTLSHLEAEWIRLMGGDGPLEPTRVRFREDGTAEILSGILTRLPNRIVRWDRRSRRAVFEITLCGERKEVRLGIETEETEKETDPNADG